MSRPSREAERILREYERRTRDGDDERYVLSKPAVLFLHQQRVRALVDALAAHRIFPMEGKRILDVGCGRGNGLADYEAFGARREDLAGIELSADRARAAAARFHGADIRTGDAATLPWATASFDVVVQSTMFSSILDDGMKRAIASEMARVLRGGGVIVWCDFFVDNPLNPNVRGVRAAELRGLFPEFAVDLRRIMLAPPIARRLVPISWAAAFFLEKLRVVNTHYLGVLRK